MRMFISSSRTICPIAWSGEMPEIEELRSRVSAMAQTAPGSPAYFSLTSEFNHLLAECKRKYPESRFIRILHDVDEEITNLELMTLVETLERGVREA